MIRVAIQEQFAFDGVAVSFGMALGGRVTAIARFENGRTTWDQIGDESAVHEPSLRIDNDMARALLEELTRHYHGADDTRALRKDYDAERARVDRLQDAVIRIAERPSP